MGATSLSREGLSKGNTILAKFHLPFLIVTFFTGPSSTNNLLMNTSGYSSQNLYVQPPTRGAPGQFSDADKSSNLAPRNTPGRSRGPLMDVSLSQLDRPATPADDLSSPPPRPALPRPEDYYSSRRQLYEEDPLSQRNKMPM
jgi:tight junction protein 1